MIYCVYCGVEVEMDRTRLERKNGKMNNGRRVCKDTKACKLRALDSDIEDTKFDISDQKLYVSEARKEFRKEVKALVHHTKELWRLRARKAKVLKG